jgi:hypothetical protein
MNSDDTSPSPASPPKPEILTLIVWHQVPSVNKILAMDLWTRIREKFLTHAAVLFALRATAYISPTSGTYSKSTLLTHWSALGCWLMTRRNSRLSASGKGKSRLSRRNAP